MTSTHKIEHPNIQNKGVFFSEYKAEMSDLFVFDKGWLCANMKPDNL